MKYRVLQSETDEDIKNRVLSIIRYCTFEEGGVDFDKVNPTNLTRSYGISLEDVQEVLPDLISEGKIEVV